MPAPAGIITEVLKINGNGSGTRRGGIHRTICDLGYSAQPSEEEPFQGIDLDSTDWNQLKRLNGNGIDNRQFEI